MGLFDEVITKEDKQDASFLLADRMRPRDFDELVGQEHLLGVDAVLRKMIEQDTITSMILWGPPGCGKTSLAKVISQKTGMDYYSYSAVLSGINEVKKVLQSAERALALYGKRSILFIDEIHRFNKAQQDAFLPYVERGSIILIGATTENPSFEVISPLLSRVSVFVLKALEAEHIKKILLHALTDTERGLGRVPSDIDADALELLSHICSGDSRFALNALDNCSRLSPNLPITIETLKKILQKERLLYDKNGEEHYNIISALHKSIRDSDAQAALYWLARMLEGGEDRRFIARRLIRMAVEDIGLADPNALLICTAAKETFDFLGIPEGDLALAEAAVYLAYAPKSNSVYKALAAARADVQQYGSLPVPLVIRNAPTNLMKQLHYGENYRYAHDFEGNVVAQQHLPDQIEGHEYYFPTENGFEQKVKKRFAELAEFLKKPQ